MKCYIKNIILLFLGKDDGGIGAKWTCVKPIDMNKKFQDVVLLHFSEERKTWDVFCTKLRALSIFMMS